VAIDLFELGLLAPAPDHAGLLFRSESQFFIKAWPSGAEPEEFHFLKPRVLEDTADDFCAETALLIGLVDNDIPDGRPIREIG